MIRPGDIILIPFPFSELTNVKVRLGKLSVTDLKLFKHKFVALVN